MRHILTSALFLIPTLMQAAATDCYGVIKPTKNIRGVGVVHLREKAGLEVEGYLSCNNGQKPLCFSVWSKETVETSPVVVGPHSKEQLGTSGVAIPVQQIVHLGKLIPKEGYGELSLRFDHLSLEQLNNPSYCLLACPNDQKVVHYSNRLIEPQFAMIELRWIEE